MRLLHYSSISVDKGVIPLTIRSPCSSLLLLICTMRRVQHNNTSSTPSTAHRDKRSFQQSSITSFFAREDQEEDEEYWEERGPGPITRKQHARERVQRESLFPSVPSSVQADLLSVGMRVRKSVPEGYNTHKSANLPSIQTTLTKGGPLTSSTLGSG